MLIRKKYFLRHKILGALQVQVAKFYQEPVDYPDALISLSDLAKEAHLSQEKIIQQIDYLKLLDQISVEWHQDTAYYLIQPKGTAAYYDNKHLNEGRGNAFKRVRDIVLLTLSIATLIVTLYTFATNFIMTRQNNKDIEQLKNEVRMIKGGTQSKDNTTQHK